MKNMTSQKDLYKALRIISTSPAYQIFKKYLQDIIDSADEEIFTTVDERWVNRLLGRKQAISELLKELEDSPRNELAYANGDTSSRISVPV